MVLTYGGGSPGDALVAHAKARGIPVVFWAHDLSHTDAGAFANADYVIVPSEFSSEFYRQRVGVECHVLPNVIDPAFVLAQNHNPKYVTIVNPQARKRFYVVARIAEQILRRRPDIPILVVERRDAAKALQSTRADMTWAKDLFSVTNGTDPREFYGVTKLLLMPSLLDESFGLAAAEAMANGIPVLASNRGALPETVGDGGILLDIPPQYTPESAEQLTAAEIEPWVETTLRLWDDGAFYRQQSEKTRACAARWHPDRLRPLYVEFFRNVHS